MPYVHIEGDALAIEISEHLYRRGRFLRSVIRDRRNLLVTIARHADGSWSEVDGDFAPVPPPHEAGQAIWQIPAFDGWEKIEKEKLYERNGYYILICIDPTDPDYLSNRNPNVALASSGRFNQAWGLEVREGWVVYKKIKPAGPQRFLPNNNFSKPLPLP